MAMQKQSAAASRSSRKKNHIGPLLIAAGLAAVVAGGWYTDSHRPLPNPLQPTDGWRWWVTPVERNAFMRIPVVTGAFYGVDASGEVIWAVGEQGLIVGTIDGGRTWRRGRIVPTQPAASVTRAAAGFDIADALNPFASALAEQPPEDQKKADAYDVNAQSAKEAGVPDVRQTSPVDATQSVIEQRAQRVVSDPKRDADRTAAPVQTRADESQVQQRIPEEINKNAPVTPEPASPETELDIASRATLRGVAVLDEMHAIAVGDDGVILATRDGGETWSPRSTNVRAPLNAVAFADARAGIAVGERGTVLRTVDGGETWIPEALASSEALIDVAPADEQNWVAVGENGRLLKSRDGGRTWNDVRNLSQRFMNAVAFADASRGVAVGAGGTVLLTRDAGESWEPAASGDRASFAGEPTGPTDLTDVVFDGQLILTSSLFDFYSSEDGGYEWSVNSIHAGYRNAFRLANLPSGRVIAAGLDGSLLVSSGEADSWAPLTAYRQIFSALEMFDRARGVIVGARGSALTTTDGGRTWIPRYTGTRANLTLLQINENANAIALADDGTLVDSEDSGRTWTVLPDSVLTAPARRSLEAVLDVPEPFKSQYPLTNSGEISRLAVDPTSSTVADATRALITTTDGIIRRTEDAGRSWSESSSGTVAPAVDIAYVTPERAIALAQGRVMISEDAGKTFKPVQYRRYPSPWLWAASMLLVAASALLLRRSMRKPEVEQQTSSITDAAASDRPIGWNDPDPAGLREIALGLSRFLRNRRTEPPLTIAVTGEWGTGKSSLMNLLRHDLVRYGYRPVWFNAWHHQSGESLLGSLLANIHAQGVPPLHTVAGIDFRLTLLSIRARRFWLRLAVTLFLIAVVFFSYRTLGASAAELWAALTEGDVGITNIGAATGLLGLLAAVLTPVVGALRATSAFGLQPAKLIAAVATTKHDESARLQAGARFRFAREFADFTHALDTRPLVIFIDDLDRCRAENVIEVLEAVNFLISSGRCIVVIGMARRWVETCVGLAFRELAEAHVEARPALPENGSAESLTEQQIFARNYLEKLINVEIRVPRLSDSAASAILQGRDESATPSGGLRYGVGTVLLRAGPVIVLAALVAGIVALGKTTAEWLGRIDATSQLQTTAQPAASTSRQQPSPAADPQRRSEPGQDRPIVFDAPSARAPMGWYLGTGGSVTLALVILIVVTLFARKESRTDDSPAFRDALSILQPWIVVGGSSPRSLKRFVNHVRYIAMRFRPGGDIPTTYEKLTNLIRAWFGRPTIDFARPGASPRAHLNEELLVALAALHRCGETWLDELFISRERDLDTLILRDIGAKFEELEERRAATDRLRQAIEKFNARFSESSLFENEMLDRHHAVAFYEVMAFETGEREKTSPEEARVPTPLRSA